MRFLLRKVSNKVEPLLLGPAPPRMRGSTLGLVPGEVVMLAGLQDDQEDETQNHLPLFGWLMGQERQNKRSEILMFLEVQHI